jgi:phosphoglycolate phosphatase-like HAD superfamily hydrolase
MPLSLEQYATWLDGRHDLPWPAPPTPEPANARPTLKRLRGVRAVLWNVYGTLLSIPLGELVFEHPTSYVMTMALEKTIAEFKMWASMSRKPGAPSEYMGHLYGSMLDEQRLAPSPGEKHPEIVAERVWEGVLKKLFAKEYAFDAGFYGSLNEYSKKIAYFFHASMQGTAAYPGADRALQAVADAGLVQGLCADGQCFTPLQLQRGLSHLDPTLRLDETIPEPLQTWSHAVRGRKPSERLFRHALEILGARGIEPHEVLHVGSRLARDIEPAKKLGMRTALFAGDRASLDAPKDQVNVKSLKPNVLLTELEQIAEVIGS